MQILILGAGGAASNGVARCLSDHQLHGSNSNPYDLLLAPVNAKHLLPPAREEQWLPQLQALVAREGIAYVHAQADTEVLALARHRDAVGAAAFLPSTESIEICLDKWRSYELWREAGVPAPPTRLAYSRIGISKAMKAVGPEVWVRARVGSGGYKSVRTHSLAEVLRRVALDYGMYTIATALSASTVTVQQLWNRGKLCISQGRERRAWANARSIPSGVSGSTGVASTVHDEQANETALRATLAIDPEPHGIWGVDMTRAHNGVPFVTEINCGRFFTTTSEFFYRAGLNLPELALLLATNPKHKPPLELVDPLPEGLLWVRGMDVQPVLSDRREERAAAQAKALIV